MAAAAQPNPGQPDPATPSAVPAANATAAAVAALVFGLGLVLTLGFAHSATLHNAAHDSRHAMGFPCH